MRNERGSSGAVVATRWLAALTERQVAEQLGLSVARLRAWRHRGTGLRFLRLGRSVRYPPSDVDEFVRASAVDTKRQALDAPDEARRAGAGNSNGDQGNEGEIGALVEVPDGLTSQSAVERVSALR